MNPRQQMFADEYLKCGNSTQAAIKAGYSKKTARAIGSENLTKPDILNYIKERQKELSNSNIADVKEVMQFLTSVMRDNTAKMSDRLDASKEIIKRYDKSDDGKKDALAKLDDVLNQIGGVI